MGAGLIMAYETFLYYASAVYVAIIVAIIVSFVVFGHDGCLMNDPFAQMFCINQ